MQRDARCGPAHRRLGDRRSRATRTGTCAAPRLSDGTTLDVDVVVAVARLDPQRRVAGGLRAGRRPLGRRLRRRAAAPSTSTASSPTPSTWPGTSRAPPTCCTSTSSSRWSTGTTPCSGAEVAAHNMVSFEPDRRPHLLLPGFWSGQFGVNIKSVGVPPFADEIVVHPGVGQGPPLRRRLRPSGPHRRRRHLQPGQVAGVLRGTDREARRRSRRHRRAGISPST